MKNLIVFLLVILSGSYVAIGQGQTIKGRIINEELFPIPGVNIWTKDHSALLGKTDSEGRFSVVAPQGYLTVLFSGIGLEPANIELASKCELVEIVMLDEWFLDFMSLAKMNRHRLKQFRRIEGLHSEAFARGVFSEEYICYSRIFKPYERIKK